jgi:hypothetical protein
MPAEEWTTVEHVRRYLDWQRRVGQRRGGTDVGDLTIQVSGDSDAFKEQVADCPMNVPFRRFV